MTSLAHPAARPMRDASGPILLVSLPVFLALHIHGIFAIPIAEGVEIKPWNVAIPIALGAWFVLLAHARLPPFGIDRSLCVLVFAVSTLWMGFSVSRSPQLSSAAAVFAVQSLNLLLLMATASAAASVRDLRRLNRAVFAMGALIAGAAMLLYGATVWSFLSGSTDALQVRAIGASFDRGIALRLVGFAGDPNFFALYMTVPLLAGFATRPTRWRWFGLAIIGASLLLAMSRSLIIALFATSVLLAGPRLLRGRRRIDPYTRALRVGMALLAAVGATLWLASPQVRIWLMARATAIGRQSRLAFWNDVVDLWDRPILGEGLRSVDFFLGGFSHNTYLDHLVETGVIGFLLFAAFVSTVTYVGWRRRSLPGVTPWWHAWLILLAMGLTFSLAYNPLFALVAGILVGLPEAVEAPTDDGGDAAARRIGPGAHGSRIRGDRGSDLSDRPARPGWT